mgnify:CR=1 FL=1
MPATVRTSNPPPFWGFVITGVLGGYLLWRLGAPLEIRPR